MNELVTRFQLAELGALLAEPARAAIVLALIDGSARPAGELGAVAGVTAATASEHLRRLVEAGLLSVNAQGRHRYYRLADEDAAHLVETIALVARPRPRKTVAVADRALAHARTCYHHLAGRLGVALFDRLRDVEGLSLGRDAIRLNRSGQQLLCDSGLLRADDDLTGFAGRSCLDWTERRFHLAGPLGTQLTHRLLDAGWLRRRDDTRALGISIAGRAGVRALGLDWDRLGD
ncbi:MAG: helix-turn-helix transcriptional regulator [Dokdonella sp.]